MVVFFLFNFVRGGHKHLKVDLIFICPKVAKWGPSLATKCHPPSPKTKQKKNKTLVCFVIFVIKNIKHLRQNIPVLFLLVAAVDKKRKPLVSVTTKKFIIKN
jgi:hypothetical protein